MQRQSKLGSAVESALNVLSGFILALGVSWAYFRVLGTDVRMVEVTGLTVIMTFVSFTRVYVVRRITEWVRHRHSNKV